MPNAPRNMSQRRQLTDGITRQEPFSSGWTGAASVALFIYVAAAFLLTFADGKGSRALDIFNLYSDSLASIGVSILAAAAAQSSSDPAARRT